MSGRFTFAAPRGAAPNWTARKLIAGASWSACAAALVLHGATLADVDEKTQAAAAEDAEITRLADAFVAERLSPVASSVRRASHAPSLKPAAPAARFADPAVVAASVAAAAPIELDAPKAALALRSERDCLADAIYYEARGESVVGRLAVADVVLNRVKNRHYPSTICGVVYQGSERVTGCQFSFTCDGSMDARVIARKRREAEDLAGAVLAGLDLPVSRDATHYHANYVDPYWAKNLVPTAEIGTHKFYRFPSKVAMAAAPGAL